jgi:Domain of unknown function (DUF4375)
MNDYSQLDEAAKAVYEEMNKLDGDPLRLTPALQPVAILYTLQAMIDNGGFRYIFENDFPFSPPYSVFVDAYRKIGANTAADCLEKAVALFPFENPHLKQEERNTFMDKLTESDLLFQLGDFVCGDKTVWDQMQNYVIEHQDEFLTNQRPQ